MDGAETYDTSRLGEGPDSPVAWIVELHEAIRARVRQGLGPRLRQTGDSEDFQQDVVARLLQAMPPLRSADRQVVWSYVMRVVDNHLRERARHQSRARRAGTVEVPPADVHVFDADQRRPEIDTPSAEIRRRERVAAVRVALEFLSGADRHLILGHHFDGRTFGELGDELGISAGAAKMRHRAAQQRLAEHLRSLETRGLPRDYRDHPAEAVGP